MKLNFQGCLIAIVIFNGLLLSLFKPSRLGEFMGWFIALIAFIKSEYFYRRLNEVSQELSMYIQDKIQSLKG